MMKIESYLIVDKLRDIDDAVDKISKTFLVKMERVFSQDNDDVDKPLPITNKTIKMESAGTHLLLAMMMTMLRFYQAMAPPVSPLILRGSRDRCILILQDQWALPPS